MLFKPYTDMNAPTSVSNWEGGAVLIGGGTVSMGRVTSLYCGSSGALLLFFFLDSFRVFAAYADMILKVSSKMSLETGCESL